MKKELKIPSMGESIVEVEIGELLKLSGSFVKLDEEILEIETDKANQALYSPATGLLTLTVTTGDMAKIGQVIGFVEEQNVKSDSPSSPPSSSPKRVHIEREDSRAKEEVSSERVDIERKESPAKEEVSSPLRVSIQESLKETPKIEKAPEVMPPFEKRTKISKIRRVIAERLLQATQNTAMLTTFNEIDMKEVIALRTLHQERFQKEHGVKLGFMSFFVKATLSALRIYPIINSFLEGDEIVTPLSTHIGIAVSTERGLIVPVLKNAETLTFAGIEQQIANFAKKAKESTLLPDDLSQGSFTITNGGVFGSLFSTPILNPPQSAILGMHKIQERPIAINKEVEIRPMMYVALSYDHRLIDGKDAVSFLVHLKKCLEDPNTFLLEL